MQKTILIFALLICALTCYGQSMKVVVDRNNVPVGRYVRTNSKTYTILIQDDYECPKKGHKVVTYSAEKGQGIVYNIVEGPVNVRQQPNTSAKIVTKICDMEEGMPDICECLGKVKGWYKVKVNGKVGYVRQDLVHWDAICTM